MGAIYAREYNCRQPLLTKKYSPAHSGLMMNDKQKAASLAAFASAIEKAGGQVRLGHTLSCSQARISRILAGESVLDAEMAARIHRDVGVPKWELRPDLFDPPPVPIKPAKIASKRAVASELARLKGKIAAKEKKASRAKSGTRAPLLTTAR
jgi:DNA-binding transcriptional regulator YdaS (Cro superfamily)